MGDEMAAANDGSAISVEVWHNKLTPVTDRRTDQLLGTCKLAFELIHQNPLRDSSVEDDCYVLDALQCDSTLRSSTTFGLKICVDQESAPTSLAMAAIETTEAELAPEVIPPPGKLTTVLLAVGLAGTLLFLLAILTLYSVKMNKGRKQEKKDKGDISGYDTEEDSSKDYTPNPAGSAEYDYTPNPAGSAEYATATVIK